MIGVEDIGDEEHWEEQEDPGVLEEGLPEADKFGLPRRVLHHDDLCAILTDDLVGVTEKDTENESNEHEDNECGVRSIGHGTPSLVDVLGKGDL